MNRPEGCIEIQFGSLSNSYEKIPFISSWKLQNFIVLSEEHEANKDFTFDDVKMVIFFLWKPEGKNGSIGYLSESS
jgi:hypothetical protein